MKRLRMLYLVLALLLSCFAGCGTGEPQESSTETTMETLTGNTTQETTQETTLEPTVTEHVHTYTEQVREATCAEGGAVIYTCDCGHCYEESTDALGHSYKDQTVAPSGSSQGYTQHTCSHCGYSYRDNYTWSADAPASFFDDAAFIGDSVTLALRNYNAKKGVFGKATFLCVGSYSVNNAVTGQLKLSYQGQEMGPADALAACGAKKVFILLGMNDIALAGEKSIGIAMENWATMLSSIRAKNPDITVYIQSGTPVYTDGQKGGINNNRMNAYNESLKEFAANNGCIYVDIATAMKDSTGGLAEKYCSDSYVHLTEAACALWESILKSYV